MSRLTYNELIQEIVNGKTELEISQKHFFEHCSESIKRENHDLITDFFKIMKAATELERQNPGINTDTSSAVAHLHWRKNQFRGLTKISKRKIRGVLTALQVAGWKPVVKGEGD